MEKLLAARYLCRSLVTSSYGIAAVSQCLFRFHCHQLNAPRCLFNLSSPPSPSDYSKRVNSGGIGHVRFFSEDVAQQPAIKDTELLNAFKDLMAASWDKIPESVINDVVAALSKSSNDKAEKEVVENVFRAAEAVEEFSGMLVSLKMEIDDTIGLSGEDVKPLPNHLKKALEIVYDRYTTYLDGFGPDEGYLRKKVETELGAKMIHLKMRCSGLGPEWGKVTVLGTSGLSGSYVEHRA